MSAAQFIEPMPCLAVKKLPEGEAWQYELKLDGYRALALGSGCISNAPYYTNLGYTHGQDQSIAINGSVPLTSDRSAGMSPR